MVMIAEFVASYTMPCSYIQCLALNSFPLHSVSSQEVKVESIPKSVQPIHQG